MSDSPYHWETIARFWAPGPAVFLKSMLEGYGIPVFVRNEYMGGLFARLSISQALGGIELQVPSDRVEEAKALLVKFEDGNNDVKAVGEGDDVVEETEEYGLDANDHEASF
ncbi:MAG: DUF2007 domain-containing protein [Candidatus Hydrogenedentes bacterium]|nr:DUF2007 domain-containing protein [Candidatus Hydrogenedentota bacterium]